MPSSPAGKAVIELSLNDKISKGLKVAENSVKKFSQSISRIGAGLTGISAAILTPLGLAAKSFADLDDQIRLIGAITSASESDITKLTDRIEELGATTSFTASEVAEAAVALGRAGFSPKEIDETLESMLALSRATGQDLARSTEVAAAALRSFGLQTDQAGRVADILTATADGSSQTLDDLGEGLKLVAPLAKLAGFSLEEMSASLGALADAGQKGSLASTALKNAIVKLSSGSTQKKLEALGVPIKNAQGNFISFNKILSNLAQRVKNFPRPKQIEILSDFFDLRAGPGVAIMIDNLDKIVKSQDKLNNVNGLAIKIAKDMESGIGGSIRRLTSSFEGFVNIVGKGVAPVFNILAELSTSAFTSLRNLAKENPNLVSGMAQLGVAIGVAGGALVALGTTAALIGLSISGIGSIISGVVAVVGFLKLAIVALGGVILSVLSSPLVTVGILLAALTQYFFDIIGAASKLKTVILGDLKGAFDVLKETFQGVVDALKAGDLALAGEIAVQGLLAAWLQGTDGIRKAWISLKQNLVITAIEVVDSFKRAFENIAAFAQIAFAKIKSLANQFKFNIAAGILEFVGDEEGAQGALELANEAVQAEEKNLERINKKYDDLRKKREQDKNAVQDAVFQGADDERDAVTKRLEDAKKKLSELNKSARQEKTPEAKEDKQPESKNIQSGPGAPQEKQTQNIAASVASSLAANTVDAFRVIFGNTNPLVNLSRQQLSEQKKTNKALSNINTEGIV